MQNELTCNQVIALMNFYVEDKLNEKLKSYVEDHLRKCPKCREIYMQSQKVISKIFTDKKKKYQTTQYKEFKNNISAYIDNELDEKDSVRIKKIAITNPLARKDLEDMYTFKRLLHNSFEKTRSEWKTDYSRQVINKMDIVEPEKTPIYKIIGIFTAMLILVVCCLITMLYF